MVSADDCGEYSGYFFMLYLHQSLVYKFRFIV